MVSLRNSKSRIKMYEWVLEHHDNRFARVGLAAVHEDNGEHVKALRLYKSVLN